MKKVVLSLVLLPIFLITSLNFYKGEEVVAHLQQQMFSLTCSACHATIIDGIIVDGKTNDYIYEYLDIDLKIPEYKENAGVVVAVSGEDNNFNDDMRPIYVNELSEYYALELKKPKDNTIKIRHKITELEKVNGFVEIEGVLSNFDGTAAGESAFYKKISLVPEESAKLYPSLAQQFVYFENLKPNSSIQIFNALGQEILNTFSSEAKAQIDVSSFENGSYFALLNNKQRLKFVVRK